MPGRSLSGANGYRYGFNGKENDNEVKGIEGSQQDYGMRIYDPRLGRFLSVDPLTKKYPELTPYQFASNTPIWAIDIDGAEMGLPLPYGEVWGEDQPVNARGEAIGASAEFLDLNEREAFEELKEPERIEPVTFEEFIEIKNNPSTEHLENQPSGQTVRVPNVNLLTRTNNKDVEAEKETLETNNAANNSNTPSVRPSVQQYRAASVNSEAIVRARIIARLGSNQRLVEKPRFYINGGNGSYTTPDFAIYNTETRMFDEIIDAKNGNGGLTGNQEEFERNGGEFKGSSRYKDIPAQNIDPQNITIERTNVPY